MRASACDTVPRLCARPVLCWLAFPSASALGSTGSAADRSALFVGFPATMAESDSPRPCIIGYGSSPSRCGPDRQRAGVGRGVSRFPRKERPHMPVSTTTPGRLGARDIAPIRIAFRQRNDVGAREEGTFAAQWLACALPCQRFADALAGNCA
jgi:hypothetical protein